VFEFAPTGRTYSTKPGGSLFFPILATPTGEAAIRKLTTKPAELRGLMMPRRTRTRTEEHNERITAERRINEQRLKRQRWLFDELEKTPTIDGRGRTATVLRRPR